MNPIWLPFAMFWLALAVGLLVRSRKTKRVGFLAASAACALAAGAFVFLAAQIRPNLVVVNTGAEPVLVSVEGEFAMRKLVPTEELSTRYDLGADLTITRLTDAGPGKSGSFPLPDGEDKQVFRASASVTSGGTILVFFDRDAR